MSQLTEKLYAELKGDIAAVTTPLFDLSKRLLGEIGNFLPHGYVLVSEGKDRLVGVSNDRGDGTSTSAQILPLLHEGLRAEVKRGDVRAIGVAENVTISQENGSRTKAIGCCLSTEMACALHYISHSTRSCSAGTSSVHPSVWPPSPKLTRSGHAVAPEHCSGRVESDPHERLDSSWTR